MSFLTGKIEVILYTDSAQTEFPKEKFPDISKEFSSSSITESQTVIFNLAAAANNTINLNGVGTVKRFYIYSDAADLSVNINGLGNITFQATEPGYVPATVSSMVITNASASLATNVTLVLIAS